LSVQTVSPVSDGSRLFDKFVGTKSSPERMLAKVVYEVGKNGASQSLHFYHIFNPTFLPKNENLS
jgi:hypothetical protein